MDKNKLQSMSRDQLENAFLKVEKKLIEEMQEKARILMIAKPFFNVFMNVEWSKFKDIITPMKIAGIVSDLMGMDDSSMWDKAKSMLSSKKKEESEANTKEVIVKASKILAKNGIVIPVDEIITTTEEDLLFIKSKLENI